MLNQINYSTFILRGGGCGMTKTNFAMQSQNNSIQTDVYDFFLSFNNYIYIIESNEQASSEIMIAIRWFIFQEENIYKINKNVQSVKKSSDLVLDGIRRLLISCQTYIRSDFFKCLYILQIKTSLSKVIFSFHLMNDERFMKCETQNYFLEIYDGLQQQMEIERNDLIQNQIELFLFLTKTSFEIAPNYSKEKEEILTGSLKVQILNYLNSYQREPVCFIKCKIFLKRDNNMKFFIKQTCCNGRQQVILKKEKYRNLVQIILQIEAIYETLVKCSINWREHYIWIQMIGKLLVFNPLLTKKKFGQLNNPLNVGLNNDLAVIQLNQLENNNINQVDGFILEDSFKGWEDFLILKQFLMNEENENTPFTMSSYLKCKLDQNQEKNFTIEKMQTLFSFLISSKLINIIKQNDESLREVIKIWKNKYCNQQFKKFKTLEIFFPSKIVKQKEQQCFLNRNC
ncbi:unnamed protein product [Paramecium primaurelia]|uniref:Uncharacterized protein n=1 Tax=Paramecium primaurelia TaxID=5886 RepID=A0A8S1JS03_PARPR|nr:unnamed protein product [Paramecium primaurelia]